MSTRFAQNLKWQLSPDEDAHAPTCERCGVEKSLIRFSRHYQNGALREDRVYQCLACGIQDQLTVRS